MYYTFVKIQFFYKDTILHFVLSVHAQLLNSVLLFATHGLEPPRLLCSRNFPDKNTGVGCHFLLQGIILTQGSNPSLSLHHLGHPS